MKFFYISLILFSALLFCSSASTGLLRANDDWKLRKEKNGIKIYTRDISDSNLKELRIMMDLENASFSQILKTLRNSDGYKNWLFHCTESRHMSTPAENVNISYYQFDFPWPLSDRDGYFKSTFVIDDVEEAVTIQTVSVPEFDSVKDGIVRLENHFNKWVFKKMSDRKINLTYYLKSDPGGSIPDWVVNMAVDKGPTNSLSNFRELLEAEN